VDAQLLRILLGRKLHEPEPLGDLGKADECDLIAIANHSRPIKPSKPQVPKLLSSQTRYSRER
jgi:hypothetical protein